MTLRSTALCGLLVSLICLVSCGPSTPTEYSEAGDDAMREQDYETALSHFESLLNWEGEGDVPQDKRFEAAKKSVECKIRTGKAKEGVDDFVNLKETFKDQMTAPNAYTDVQYYCTVLSDEKADFDVVCTLLEYANVNFPDQKEKFQEIADQLKSNATDEQRSKLKGLGY